MALPFAWFDNIGAERGKTTEFFANMFGWATQDIGPMAFLKNNSEMPFAATCDGMDGVKGWVPYVEVDELQKATEDARGHGATVIAENLQGPAGVATIITDPGGTPLALWKRAEGM